MIRLDSKIWHQKHKISLQINYVGEKHLKNALNELYYKTKPITIIQRIENLLISCGQFVS